VVGEELWSGVFIRTAVLAAAVLVLGAGVLLCRRWYHKQTNPQHEQPWTLQQLRQLHGAGKLTDEEFERLKARVIRELQ